jgi:hypothetical protein
MLQSSDLFMVDSLPLHENRFCTPVENFVSGLLEFEPETANVQYHSCLMRAK